MVRKLILIRHGEIPAAHRGRYVGRRNPGLSAAGRRQAEALAGEVRKHSPDIVFSSPLRRAAETAAIAVPDREIRYDDRLQEIHFGDWEGLTFGEIERQASPELIRIWAEDPDGMVFPGGESYAEFSGRVDSFFGTLPPVETVAVITHGGVLMRFLGRLRNTPTNRQWEHLPPRGGIVIEEFKS